jgi:hypothetical protein
VGLDLLLLCNNGIQLEARMTTAGRAFAMKSLMNSPKLRLALAVVLAAGMWCYADLILVPYQIADAAREGRPRGNLSDLYPRWWGSRELLLHGRDPYSAEITREIQEGYYGRALDAARPNDPKDQQGFAYPLYVVFLMAPAIKLPFATVQVAFRWILLLLIAASVPLWLAALGWRVSTTAMLTGMACVLGSFPGVQAIKLQQLTAVVCLLLAGCAAALATRRLLLAGVLLALATIKPQLAIPFAAWLAVWSLGDWRPRQRLMWSFLATLTVLVVAGELVLPGWVGRFRGAATAYLQYAGGTSLLDLALAPTWGRVISVLLFLAVALSCWRWRQAQAHSETFGWTMAMVLAATLAMIPTFAPYNQLLLVPAALLLVRWGPRLWKGKLLRRLALALAVMVVLLPWLVALVLDFMLVFLPQEAVERAWAVPLWTSWAIPFPVLAAIALGAAQAMNQPTKTGAVLTEQMTR